MFGNGVILAPGETMINGVRDISPMINNVSTWIEVWSNNTGITSVGTNIALTGLPALIDIAEIGIVIGGIEHGFSTLSVPVTVRDHLGNLQTRFSFTSNTGYNQKNRIGNRNLLIIVAITSQTNAMITFTASPNNPSLFAIVYKRRL